MLDDVMYMLYFVPGWRSSKKIIAIPSLLVGPANFLYLFKGLLIFPRPDRIWLLLGAWALSLVFNVDTRTGFMTYYAIFNVFLAFPSSSIKTA